MKSSIKIILILISNLISLCGCLTQTNNTSNIITTNQTPIVNRDLYTIENNKMIINLNPMDSEEISLLKQ
jgi:hypothetical protein